MPRKNYEEQLAYNREWRARNRERVAERDRRAYQRSKKKRIERARAYYQAHAEQMRAWQREYHKAHPEETREASQRWYREHTDTARAGAIARRKANPDAHREYARRKRARKQGAPVCDLTRSQWAAIKAAYGHRCVYCGGQFARLTQDHIKPLSKGGSHTASNVVPACGPCNSRKHVGPPPPFVVKPIEVTHE